MCVLAQMGLPMCLALLVFVYHVVKTLVVVKICPAREQIPDAVWHSGKELVSADVGHLSEHGRDIDLGHVCVMWEFLGKALWLSVLEDYSSPSPVLRNRGVQDRTFVALFSASLRKAIQCVLPDELTGRESLPQEPA